jgi:general stress protein 26
VTCWLHPWTGADAQKVRNIGRDGRVSVAIGSDTPDWSRLQGLSMAANAEVISLRSEIQRVARLLKKVSLARRIFRSGASAGGHS